MDFCPSTFCFGVTSYPSTKHVLFWLFWNQQMFNILFWQNILIKLQHAIKVNQSWRLKVFWLQKWLDAWKWHEVTKQFWIDMIFEVWELIPEQKDCQTRRISIEFAKSLTRMTSTLLKSPWQVDHLGQYSGPWEGKQTTFRSLLGAMLFKDSQWFSKLQQQLMSNAALEGYFHIFILVYQLQHGYGFWTMLSCLHLNECWKEAPTKIDYGTIHFEAQMHTSPHEYGW